MVALPRTEREARARCRRKMKSLRNRAFKLMHECAGMWDEGQVSSDIDCLLDDLDRNIDVINESMDEQIRYHDEVAALEDCN